VRAQEFCAFLLTWTYMDVGNSDITQFWDYFRVGGDPTGIREASLNALAKTHSRVDLAAMSG